MPLRWTGGRSAALDTLYEAGIPRHKTLPLLLRTLSLLCIWFPLCNSTLVLRVSTPAEAPVDRGVSTSLHESVLEHSLPAPDGRAVLFAHSGVRFPINTVIAARKGNTLTNINAIRSIILTLIAVSLL